MTMGKCIYCGNLSNNKKKATLHRFPRNAALCKQWVKLIGRENWMPTNSSLLCSDHFPEDCFTVHYNNRKLLKPGSLPTILTHEKMFQERNNILLESNHGNISESIATTEVPEAVKEENYLQPSTSKLNATESEPMTIHENIHHDHHYNRTLMSTLKKLSSVQQRLKSTLKSNKMLKQQLKRLKMKVHSLKEVVKELKKKKL